MRCTAWLVAWVLVAPPDDPRAPAAPAGTPEQTEPATDPAPTDPAPPDAFELATQAEQAFREGRLEDVVELTGRAYELSGDPLHLYAMALAERKLGHCREALIHYARVLASTMTEPERYAAITEDARLGIQKCEATLQAQTEVQANTEIPTTELESSPAPSEAVVDADDTPSDGSVDRWYRDPWGGAMFGGGLGATASGAVLWGLSIRELDASTQLDDETRFAQARTRAQRLRTTAVVALAAGGALLTGAAVRYILVARRPRRSTAWIAPTGHGRGAQLGWIRFF